MGVYKIGDIIKYTRLSKGMTQEELSDGICTTESLSRMENGHITPKREVYMALMMKMDAPTEQVSVPIYSDNLWVEQQMKKILYEKEKQDYEKMLLLISDLDNSNQLDKNIPSVRQYFEYMYAVIDYKQDKIDLQQYHNTLLNIIKITFPDYNDEFRIYRVFTSIEINIINNIAISYELMGIRDKAISVFGRLIEFYHKFNKGGEDEKEFYIIYHNFSKILGLNGDYYESIRICEEAVEMLKRQNRSNLLCSFIYNIGWNYMMIYEIEKSPNIEMYNRIKNYLKLGYLLSEVCDESVSNRKIMKETYDKFVEKYEC